MNRTNVELTPSQLFTVEKEVRYLQSVKGEEFEERIRSLVEHCLIADVVIEGLQDHAIHTDCVVMELLNQIEEVDVFIEEVKASVDENEFLEEEYAVDDDDYTH